MISLLQNLTGRLNKRREKIGMSCAVLAVQTGLSPGTVRRVLSGKELDPHLGTIASLAQALGMELRFDEEDTNVIRHRQAERKAKRLVALVQGSSALSGQGLGPAALRDMRKRATRELLEGSSRKLWAE